MLLTVQQRLQQLNPKVRKLSAEDACKECKQNSAVVLDVREPSEREASSVDASVLIPRGVLEMKALEKFPDASTPIYIHCASGARAQLAAEQLVNMGYENVTAITCKLADVKSAFDA